MVVFSHLHSDDVSRSVVSVQSQPNMDNTFEHLGYEVSSFVTVVGVGPTCCTGSSFLFDLGIFPSRVWLLLLD